MSYKKNKKHHRDRGGAFACGDPYGYFACGEYTHALRLVCKHPDLRAEYANPYSKRIAF